MGLCSANNLTIHDGNSNNTTANYGTFYLRYIKPKVSFKQLRLYEGHWQRIHNQLEVKYHVKLV